MFKVLHANTTELNILKGEEKTVSDVSHKILKQSSHSGSVYFPQVKILLYFGRVISNLDFKYSALLEQKE